MTPSDHEHLCTQTHCAFPNEPYCRLSGESKAATPEPELNVEAELFEIFRKRDHTVVEFAKSPSPVALGPSARSDVDKLLALIQQVSDQRAFDVLDELFKQASVEQKKKQNWDATKGWDSHVFITLAIEKMKSLDQTLVDYLSHKEARDE